MYEQHKDFNGAKLEQEAGSILITHLQSIFTEDEIELAFSDNDYFEITTIGDLPQLSRIMYSVASELYTFVYNKRSKGLDLDSLETRVWIKDFPFWKKDLTEPKPIFFINFASMVDISRSYSSKPDLLTFAEVTQNFYEVHERHLSKF